MKKIITIMIALFTLNLSASAYKLVKFTINDGISDVQLKAKMERAVTRLLIEINRCQEANVDKLDLGQQYMSEYAVADVTKLWANEHFRCEEDIVERCLHTKDGFQVRNIPIIVNAAKGKEELGYQEAIINFDREGYITSFYYAVNKELYSKAITDVLQNRKYEVSEIQQRMKILDYVEHFRTSYNQKDINFLEQVFSDNALIITGHVIKTEKSEMTPNGTRIIYKSQSKREYLTRLKGTFQRSRYIKVDFNDITIVPHPTKEHVYGVTVLQSWKSGTYHDEGYVFMLWDFRKKNPKIHVRTWQPEYIEPGRKIDSNEIFTLQDFDL